MKSVVHARNLMPNSTLFHALTKQDKDDAKELALGELSEKDFANIIAGRELATKRKEQHAGQSDPSESKKRRWDMGEAVHTCRRLSRTARELKKQLLQMQTSR